MWTMASTVWCHIPSARLVHSMPLLPLCHKLHHPCRLGTNREFVAPLARNVAFGKPWPTMMSHVYNWLRCEFYCSQFRFRNLLRLFTWDLNFFSKGAEAHSNASGNWSCADVYSAARTNSSVTWPCKHSHQCHSNCIQLEYENLKSLRSAPFWRFLLCSLRRLSQHGQRVGVTKVHPFGTVIRQGLGCLGCVTPWQVPMGRAMSTSALHAQVGCAMGRFWVKKNHVRQRSHWLTQCSIQDSKGRKWMNIC